MLVLLCQDQLRESGYVCACATIGKKHCFTNVKGERKKPINFETLFMVDW